MNIKDLRHRIYDAIQNIATPCDGGSCDADEQGRCLRSLDAADAVLEVLEEAGVIVVVRGKWKKSK